MRLVQEQLSSASSSPFGWLEAAQRLAHKSKEELEAVAEALGNLLCGVELARNGLEGRGQDFAAFRGIQGELGVPASYLGALQALCCLQPRFQVGAELHFLGKYWCVDWDTGWSIGAPTSGDGSWRNSPSAGQMPGLSRAMRACRLCMYASIRISAGNLFNDAS